MAILNNLEWITCKCWRCLQCCCSCLFCCCCLLGARWRSNLLSVQMQFSSDKKINSSRIFLIKHFLFHFGLWVVLSQWNHQDIYFHRHLSKTFAYRYSYRPVSVYHQLLNLWYKRRHYQMYFRAELYHFLCRFGQN